MKKLILGTVIIFGLYVFAQTVATQAVDNYKARCTIMMNHEQTARWRECQA